MKVLHTSDWHIGRVLYGKKRYEEFEAFLAWLADAIQQHAVDALIVAGDIFDTSTPSNRSQELYYRFLCKVAASTCRHVVVIAGNHDSPTFLDAPKELLRALDVHVVGSRTEALANEVLVLRNQDKQPELIVCAVPYLRDRDIRVAEAGESIEEKEQKLVDGIRDHYAQIGALAEQQRQMLGQHIPIIGTGHLFAAGGKTIDGDGVRDLYVGSLAHVTAGVFPECFDYVALGHLHVPQNVGGTDTIRYSGSPLPMGFGEAKQSKSVCLVEFDGASPTITLESVPVFQRLERIQGDWKALERRVQDLVSANAAIWLEVIYDGAEVISDLRERLDSLVVNSSVDILRINNRRLVERALEKTHQEETLDDLDVQQVFDRCLNAHEVPEDQRAELQRAFREAVTSLHEDDERAQ